MVAKMHSQTIVVMTPKAPHLSSMTMTLNTISDVLRRETVAMPSRATGRQPKTTDARLVIQRSVWWPLVLRIRAFWSLQQYRVTTQIHKELDG